MGQAAKSSDGLSERGRYWQRLIRQQASNGLTQEAFCRQHGVNAMTFAWWKGELRQRRALPSAKPRARLRPPRFREVARPVRTDSTARFEVQLPSGRTIRISAGFDEVDLRRLLGVLEAAC